MKDFRDRVAAITGAGSGIGRALAEALAERGAHLAICDIDPHGLAETAERCGRRGVTVTTAVVDVANRDAVFDWSTQVGSDHGGVNLIVNNAGVALGATVAEMSHDDLAWLMDINFWGVVNGTKAFLPHLEASGDGHVVNISSVFGLVSIPTQAAYNAAKFAVRGYTDALRMELEIADSCVSATTIHPGGIKTDIVRNARWSPALRRDVDEAVSDFERAARTTPARAADQILRAVERNRRRALIGPDAVVFDLISRLPAAVPQRLLVRAGRRQAAGSAASGELTGVEPVIGTRG